MALASRIAGRLRLAALAAATLTGLHAQPLAVRANPDGIRVSSPGAHFLEGRPLERLHNGTPAVFAVQVTLLASSKSAVLARSSGRFAVSFDIWEEKFAVTHLATPRKSVSHLSGSEAELWCLDNLLLAAPGLSRDAPFWIRLDVRAENAGEGPAPGEEMGVPLTRLVDLFSRPRQEGEVRKRIEGGPFRLKELL